MIRSDWVDRRSLLSVTMAVGCVDGERGTGCQVLVVQPVAVYLARNRCRPLDLNGFVCVRRGPTASLVSKGLCQACVSDMLVCCVWFCAGHLQVPVVSPDRAQV